MQWYVIALLLGAVVAPWVLKAAELRLALADRGVVAMFGVWFGSATITTPLMLLLIWTGKALIIDRTFWVRGLPSPHSALEAILFLAAGALGLIVLWILLTILWNLIRFLLSPLIRWLNKPL